MPATNSDLTRNCKRCSRELPPGALDCPQCHALVHEEQLERVAARARALEANGALWDGREQWQSTLPLLPPESKQAEWIRSHIQELDTTIRAPAAPDSRKRWGKWLTPLLSFAAFVAFAWAEYGPWFGIGFAVMILIHELGHFVDIKRRGLSAEMPIFLPGLGAFVRWKTAGVTLETRAAVSLAGPLAGWFAAAIAGMLWLQTGNGTWAALARSGAWLNILNLIPVWVLDGSQAVLALSWTDRAVLLAGSVALAVASHERMLFFVGAGMLWRLFTKDQPTRGSRTMTAYFLAVMAALTLVMYMMPGAGFGR